MIFMLFWEALGSLEGFLGPPWASFGHLFGVFLACSHVDVNWLPVDLPLRELKGSKMNKKGVKLFYRGNPTCDNPFPFKALLLVLEPSRQPINIQLHL